MNPSKPTSKWKRRLRNTLFIFVIVCLVLIALVLTQHRPMPEGQAGPEAEMMADRLLAAVNNEAWLNTGAVAWTFRGSHHFIWDRTRHLTQVQWDDTKVLLNINTQTGRAWQNGNELAGADADKKINKAYEYWANDSFWLNAPNKVRDGGTTRKVVVLSDGQKGLLVSYSQGGVTPGDAYLWLFDDDNRPKAWRMWVNIIPIGGLEFSWDQWQTLSTGAEVATYHAGGILNIPLANIEGAETLVELTGGEDIFMPIL